MIFCKNRQPHVLLASLNVLVSSQVDGKTEVCSKNILPFLWMVWCLRQNSYGTRPDNERAEVLHDFVGRIQGNFPVEKQIVHSAATFQFLYSQNPQDKGIRANTRKE